MTTETAEAIFKDLDKLKFLDIDGKIKPLTKGDMYIKLKEKYLVKNISYNQSSVNNLNDNKVIDSQETNQSDLKNTSVKEQSLDTIKPEIDKTPDARKGYFKKGKEHPDWKGGRRKTSDGYIEIYSPEHPNKTKNDCVLEHRLVMEKHIGRFLTPQEVVHHINENKEDNRIENLELIESKGKHSEKYHNKRGYGNRFVSQKSVGCGKLVTRGLEAYICGGYIQGQLKLCPSCSGEKK